MRHARSAETRIMGPKEASQAYQIISSLQMSEARLAAGERLECSGGSFLCRMAELGSFAVDCITAERVAH